MSSFGRVVVEMPAWVWPRWIEVAYLYPIPYLHEKWSEAIEFAPDQDFEVKVGDYVRNFITEGVMPPEAIAPVVLNLADDVMAGRKMTIRAGDYITLQNHMRGLK